MLNFKRDRQIYALLLANLLSNFCFFAMLAILTLYFIENCHFSFKLTGIFTLLVLVFSRAGRLFLLPLMSQFPIKQAMIFSSCLMTLSYFFLFFTQNKIGMLLSFFLLGMGYGCHSVYIRSQIGLHNTQNAAETKLRYVRLSVVTNLGGAIASLLAVAIFTRYTGKGVFFIASDLTLINTLCLYFLLQSDATHQKPFHLIEAIRFISNNNVIWRILLLTFLSWALYIQMYSSLPLLTHYQLHTTAFLGGLYATNAIFIVLFSTFINKYLNRYALQVFDTLLIAFACMGAGFLCLFLFPSLTAAYIAIICWTLGEILFVPALNSTLSECTTGPERLQVFGVSGIVMGLGEGAGMYLGTRLTSLQPMTQINHLYLYLLILAVACIGISLLIKKGVPYEKNENCLSR